MPVDQLLFVVTTAAFGSVSLVCFGAVFRAVRITDSAVRRGLIALLVSSGFWAAFDVGFLLLDSRHVDRPIAEAMCILSLVCGFAAVWAWLYFCSAYSRRALHRNRAVQALAGLFFLFVVVLKISNPIHDLYFSLTFAAEPFPHVAVEPRLLYWLVSGASYLLAAGGYLLLRPAITAAAIGWRPLVGLLIVTALSAGVSVMGAATPLFLRLNYEAIGVAAFAVGVLFVYDRYFIDAHWLSRDQPAVIVDDDGCVRSYNGAMADNFPQFKRLNGKRTQLEDIVPEVAAALHGGQDIVRVGSRADGSEQQPVVPERFYRITESRFGAGLESQGRLLVLTDVTAQEERRRDRDALLRGLMTSVPGIVFRVAVGPGRTARVSFASDAARHILGMAPKNGDPLVGFVKRVPATHRRRLLSTFWRAVEAGERFEFEIPFQRTEQERRWLLGEATPDAERTGMFTGVLIDITRRKESEQDFRRSERRFRALVEQAVDVVAIFDLDGDIQYLSPSVERVTGRSREQLVHTSAFALAHEEDRDRLQKAFRRAAQSPGTPVEVEGRIRHADGTDREIAVRARRVTGPGGMSQVIANIRDVTSERRYRRELIAAKEEAEEASQLKSAMIANMSHEVRTPLTSILGFAEILAEANLGPPHDRFVHMIYESGTRLLRTLNAMLDLSRLESGAADVTPHPTEAVEVAREMVASLRPQAETAGVSITVDLPDTEIHVHADREILRTILRNLIGNAIKFTPAGGTVDVRVHRGAGTGDRPEPESSAATARRASVVFEIEDTGIGMEPSFVEEALKPFRQESVGDNREYEGSGLGLAIVDRYVRLLNGSIAIDTKKGEGTRLRVTLPGSSDADLSASDAASP